MTPVPGLRLMSDRRPVPLLLMQTPLQNKNLLKTRTVPMICPCYLPPLILPWVVPFMQLLKLLLRLAGVRDNLTRGKSWFLRKIVALYFAFSATMNLKFPFLMIVYFRMLVLPVIPIGTLNLLVKVAVRLQLR